MIFLTTLWNASTVSKAEGFRYLGVPVQNKTFFIADGYITSALQGSGSVIDTCYLTNPDGSWVSCAGGSSYMFGITIDTSVSGSWTGAFLDTHIRPFVIINGQKQYLAKKGTTYFRLSGIASPVGLTYGFDYSYLVDYNPSGNTLGSKYFFINAVIDRMEVYIVEDEAGAVGTPGENQINNTIKEQTNIIKEQTDAVKEQTETTKGIFAKITDFFGSFFENIMNAFKSLFVPEDGYFGEYFTRLNDFFSQKLGMLYAPIGIFIDILTSIGNASSADAGIQFSGFKWQEIYVIEPQVISLGTIFAEVPELQEKIYFISNILMIGAVLMLLQDKLREVLRN